MNPWPKMLAFEALFLVALAFILWLLWKDRSKS